MHNLNPLDLFSLHESSFEDLFIDCAFPWDALKKLKKYIESKPLGKIHIDIPSSCTLVNPELISIGEGTIIEPHAYIEGPCIIGKNCLIRHGAYIRSHSIIDNHCLIGHASEIKHSILLKDAKAPHFNYVGDSIIGSNVNLGAGVICANLRIDNKEVIVHFQEKKFSTGLVKLGAMIGDGAKIGCNCVTNPGTVISPLAICPPCVSLKGCVTPGTTFNQYRPVQLSYDS